MARLLIPIVARFITSWWCYLLAQFVADASLVIVMRIRPHLGRQPANEWWWCYSPVTTTVCTCWFIVVSVIESTIQSESNLVRFTRLPCTTHRAWMVQTAATRTSLVSMMLMCVCCCVGPPKKGQHGTHTHRVQPAQTVQARPRTDPWEKLFACLCSRFLRNFSTRSSWRSVVMWCWPQLSVALSNLLSGGQIGFNWKAQKNWYVCVPFYCDAWLAIVCSALHLPPLNELC